MRRTYTESDRFNAALLREGGCGIKTIARRLGIPATTIRRWVNPEFAERLRASSREAKRRRKGICIDCGGPTHLLRDASGFSERCQPCRTAYMQTEEYRLSQTIWTQDVLIAKVKEWTALYGEPPAIPDWNPGNARRINDEARARRFEDANGYWPSFHAAYRQFGSWSAMLVAAGFAARPPHGGGGNEKRRRVLSA